MYTTGKKSKKIRTKINLHNVPLVQVSHSFQVDLGVRPFLISPSLLDTPFCLDGPLAPLAPGALAVPAHMNDCRQKARMYADAVQKS